MLDQSIQGDIHLPDDVIDALISAAREVGARETWLPASQGILVRIVPRAIRILHAAALTLPEKKFERRTIRQNTLRVLAYARADIRLGALFELAVEAPEALRDLLGGDVDQEYEPYRYNMIVTLGIFARHGLVHGVTRPDRMKRVSHAMNRARDMRKNRLDGVSEE